MTNKIIQKVIAGIIVNLLILQTLPVVSAEELVTPVSETPTTVSEPVITEPITDATVEPAPDSTDSTVVPIVPVDPQSIPGDDSAPTATTEPSTEPSLDSAPEPASAPTPATEAPQYNQLMRQVDKTVDFTFTENSFYKVILQNFPQELKEEKYEASVENVTSELEIFIDSEKEKLADSAIDESKKEQYFNQLEKQLDIIEGDIPPEAKPLEEVKIAPEPSSFTLDQKEIEIEQVEDLFVEKNVDPGLMEDTLKKLKLIQVAEAYVDNYMPVLEDLMDDGSEVIINQEIRDLARELEGNPVKIFNFVRNNIDYEPYYGAKKNSTGCLRERVCNDVDTASLTIALMRASGIQARYKRSLAIGDVRILKELLGVEQTQTIFRAMQSPLFTVDGEHDFNAMTKLAVQWVHPEIFYPYDERSGNFSVTAHPEFADINEMRAFLREFNDNQWIPVDAAMKSYSHTANEIVSDTEDFDTENFWQQYLEYQGESSPIQLYEEELGLNPENEQTRSGKTLIREEFDFLPYTLPYLVAQGNAEGNEIAIENFSALPDVYKNHVTISLLNEADGQTVFSHTFTASEVNNTPIDLYYQGFTDLDETTIVEHGGVHATPAALVDIKPLLIVAGEQYAGDQPLQIGQSLLLQFEYPEFDKVDQKFSVAGNQEGIYMYFSKLQDDQFFDDEADPDRNSKILLEGNAMMAREYLRKVEDNTDTINAYLDYDYDVAVHRAVVTQKRILNELDDIATTFDFKGLSIDASLYGNGYSNRGPLETHSDDFSLLWLLYASYYESQLFTDLTGLNAISTVTGLQYAYGNPDQYDVITVTSDNSAIIDDLDFSENTKANMRSDLASGATIITPNKPVQKENWHGVVYISRLPDGVDNYAIGEQAMGNGGETVDQLTVTAYTTEHKVGGNTVDIVVNMINKTLESGDEYTYEDGLQFDPDLVVYGIGCTVSESFHNEKVNDPNWQEKWGAPCFKETKTFGSIEYTYLLAAHAAKFHAGSNDQESNFENYSYWIEAETAADVIKRDKNEDNSIANVKLSSTGFKFNLTARTYSWYGSAAGEGSVTTYYEPTSDGGEGHPVYGTMLEELANNEASLLNEIGFPTYKHDYAGSDVGTSGWYQNFIGGQIFERDDAVFNDIFYTKGLISEHYQKAGSIWSDFGFPIDNQIKEGNELFQDFEGGIITVTDNKASGDGEPEKTITAEYILNNDGDYWEGVFDQFTEEGIVGVAIDVSSGVAISKTFTKIMQFLYSSDKFKSKLLKKGLVKFVPVVGWAFLGASVLMSAEEIVDLTEACDGGANYKYYCGKRDAVLVLVGLGIIGNQVAKTKVAHDFFRVSSNTAKKMKYKIYSLLKDDKEMNDLITLVKSNSLKRTKFFENLDGLDDDSLRKILEDDKLSKKLIDQATSFYGKFKIKQVLSGNERNTFLSVERGYNNPLPFTPNKNVIKLEITDAVTEQEFVEFIRTGNGPSRFLIRTIDIPWKNGKIDTEKLRKIINNPEGDITEVRKYVPTKGDILFEGNLNVGIDENIMQYEFQKTSAKLFDSLTDNEKSLIFKIDPDLTSKLP